MLIEIKKEEKFFLDIKATSSGTLVLSRDFYKRITLIDNQILWFDSKYNEIYDKYSLNILSNFYERKQ